MAKSKSIIDEDLFLSIEELMGEVNSSKVVLPTTPAIDYRIGGGFLGGSLVLIRSKPKVGKTATAMQIVANALKQGRYGVVADAENRFFAKKYLLQYGDTFTNNEKFKLLKSKVGEKQISGEVIYDTILTMMKLPKYRGAVYVIDSVSKITPQCTIDDESVKPDRRDLTPKLNADFCKKAGSLIRTSESIVIGIQHLITDTSPMGMGRLTPDGGTKLSYEADYVLESKHGQLNLDGESIALEKGNDQLDGQLVRWDLPYNKMLAPYVSKDNASKILGYIKFGEGCWWAKEALAVLENIGLVMRGGAWYTFMTEKISDKVQGAEKAMEVIAKNRDYFEGVLQQYYIDTYGVSYNFIPYQEN